MRTGAASAWAFRSKCHIKYHSIWAPPGSAQSWPATVQPSYLDAGRRAKAWGSGLRRPRRRRWRWGSGSWGTAGRRPRLLRSRTRSSPLRSWSSRPAQRSWRRSDENEKKAGTGGWGSTHVAPASVPLVREELRVEGERIKWRRFKGGGTRSRARRGWRGQPSSPRHSRSSPIRWASRHGRRWTHRLCACTRPTCNERSPAESKVGNVVSTAASSVISSRMAKKQREAEVCILWWRSKINRRVSLVRVREQKKEQSSRRDCEWYSLDIISDRNLIGNL